MSFIPDFTNWRTAIKTERIKNIFIFGNFSPILLTG